MTTSHFDVSNSSYQSLGLDSEENRNQSDLSPEEIINKPLETIAKFSLLTKIHVGVAFVSCITLFLVWHYTVTDTKNDFWWWIYPFFLFSMTLTAQVHYQSQQYWRGVVMIVVIANFMLFLTDGLSSRAFPKWWVYPAILSAMILVGISTWRMGTFTAVTTAFYEYCLVNVLFFMVWLEYLRGFPWFVLPMFLLAVPLSVVYMRMSYAETRIWLYVIVSLVLVDLMLFLVWGFVDSGFPWFLIVWAVSGAVIIFLYWKFKGEGTYDVVAQDGAIPYPSDNFVIQTKATVVG